MQSSAESGAVSSSVKKTPKAVAASEIVVALQACWLVTIMLLAHPLMYMRPFFDRPRCADFRETTSASPAGMANALLVPVSLSALGEAGFSLWDYWSRKAGERYSGQVAAGKHWASFKGTDADGALTIFKMALIGQSAGRAAARC